MQKYVDPSDRFIFDLVQNICDERFLGKWIFLWHQLLLLSVHCNLWPHFLSFLVLCPHFPLVSFNACSRYISWTWSDKLIFLYEKQNDSGDTEVSLFWFKEQGHLAHVIFLKELNKWLTKPRSREQAVPFQWLNSLFPGGGDRGGEGGGGEDGQGQLSYCLIFDSRLSRMSSFTKASTTDDSDSGLDNYTRVRVVCRVLVDTVCCHDNAPDVFVPLLAKGNNYARFEFSGFPGMREARMSFACRRVVPVV